MLIENSRFVRCLMQSEEPTLSNSNMEEVPLYNRDISLKERELIETLAEIYSIIVTIDQVEKLYLKDVIEDESAYTNLINKLLAQYNTLIANNENDPDFKEKYGRSITEFSDKYNIIAPNGVIRLEKGIPMTVEHFNNTSDSSSGVKNVNSKNVAEATGNFITIMDAIKLNYKTKDQLHPLMAELLLSINRIGNLQLNDHDDNGSGRTFEENKKKLVEWIVRINKMKMSEELDDKDCKELLFDLDIAYKSFFAMLN